MCSFEFKAQIPSKRSFKKYFVLGNSLLTNYEFSINIFFSSVYRRWDFSISDIVLYGSLFFLSNNCFFVKFFRFDFYFIFRPILLVFLLIGIAFSFLFLNYLLYIYLLNVVSKRLAFLTKLLAKKKLFYFICFCNSVASIVHCLNIQNLTNENFFKEVFFMVLLFLC